MRTKEELVCVVLQIVMGLIMLVGGWIFISTSSNEYIGVWEGMMLIFMTGGWGFILDGALTIYSEITCTPKKTILELGIDDDEEL